MTAGAEGDFGFWRRGLGRNLAQRLVLVDTTLQIAIAQDEDEHDHHARRPSF